jgi:hypothetical protein
MRGGAASSGVCFRPRSPRSACAPPRSSPGSVPRPAAYEVGADVRDAFLAQDPAAEACFAANARGRWQADLYGLARRSLSAAGVAAVSGGGFCTYGEPERFFSHRREAPCGRMATMVWLDKPGSDAPSRLAASRST